MRERRLKLDDVLEQFAQRFRSADPRKAVGRIFRQRKRQGR
jgi:hypothetical protein